MAELLSETYQIKKTVNSKTVTIYVDVTSAEEVSIRNEQKHPQFAFTKSDPDLIAAMAEAFEEASQLVRSRKETANG